MKEILDNIRQSGYFRLTISKIAITSFLIFSFSSGIFSQKKTTLSDAVSGSQVKLKLGY